MILAAKAPDGSPWVEAALQALGAQMIAYHDDGIEVTPDIDLSKYSPTAVKPLVPQSVTRAQAKIALLRSGHLDMVKTAVGSSPEAEIWFEDATIWERQNPYIIELGEKLLGGADEIDALFIAAAKVTA